MQLNHIQKPNLPCTNVSLSPMNTINGNAIIDSFMSLVYRDPSAKYDITLLKRRITSSNYVMCIDKPSFAKALQTMQQI